MTRRTLTRRTRAFVLVVVIYAVAFALFALVAAAARLDDRRARPRPVTTSQHGPIAPAPTPTTEG